MPLKFFVCEVSMSEMLWAFHTADEGGDDTTIANPVPAVPRHDAHTWLHPTFNRQHPDPREA